MEKNWLIINGWKIVIEGPVQIESTSPFSDKTYVFFAGSKLSTRGESSYPFQVAFSPEDLSKVGYPHLAQNTSVRNLRIQNVELYSNGVQRFKGILILTSIRPNLNTGYVKAEGLLFDPISDFVNQINNKNVNELPMGGVRVIEDLDGDDHTPMNYYTNPMYPGGAAPGTVPTSAFAGINKMFGSTPSFSFTYPEITNNEQPYFSIKSNSNSGQHTDLCGTSTADYAAIVTLNGDPEADEHGGLICFPTIFVPDEQDGDTWLNFWDPTGLNYYPCAVSCPDNTTGVDIYADNVYQDMGNHIVPMYYYHQVVRHCFSDLGYKLVDDSGLLSDPHFKRLVLVNNFDILNVMTISYTNSDGSKNRTVGYWQGRTLINPKNHLPADTVQTFLLDFMVKFNCYFEFSNGNAYLRAGNFNKVDREFKDYHPEPLIEDTLDTGITLAYDFPSDKQYDNVKKVVDITKYQGTEKVFQAGFNKLYPVALRDAIPSPLPKDDYYGVLYEDCNQVTFAIADTPLYNPPSEDNWYFPNHFYIDNVLPITMGVDTRPDSPSVNLQEATQANTNNYSLKYPPISHINNSFSSWSKQTPYKLNAQTINASATDRITVVGDVHYGTGSWQGWTVGNSINSNIGAGLVVPVGWIVEYHSLIPPVTGPAQLSGFFIAYGIVTGYNNETGWLNFTVTYVMPPQTDPVFDDDHYFASNLGGGYFGWNSWTIQLKSSQGFSPPISAPIMQTPVVSYPTQDYAMTPTFLYAYTYDFFFHSWAFNTLYSGSSGWSQDISSGILMPSDWITRSSQPIFETGFYWSRPTAAQAGESDKGLVAMYYDTITGSAWNNFTHAFSTPISIPVLTGYERVYGNGAITPGWFNLSLHGPYSIPAQFWKGFINQYLYNRKVTITVYESMTETMQHKFWNAVLWRGAKLYVSQIRTEVPYIGKGVEYLCYFI